jgi:hypothetical protein
MKALIDGDIFAYSFGSCTDDFGRPLPWPLVATRINSQIEGIVEGSEADSYQIYLTSEDKSNFRLKVATIKPYKGQRPVAKPYWYEQVRRYLVKFRGAIVISGMEADDKLSIEQWKNHKDEKCDYDTIICSLDKDLMMVPGWHYNWTKKKKEWISETEGLRNFYCQLLTGDGVDNIPGLHGVGNASTFVKRVHTLDSEQAMFDLVQEQYEKRFGSYWWMFLTENAQLLWMLREEPTKNRHPEDQIWQRLFDLDIVRSWKELLQNRLKGLK